VRRGASLNANHGEAVVLGVDGMPDFNALHSRKHDEEVQFYAFDMLAGDGDDMRALPLSMRKTNLAQLLARRPDGIFVAPFDQLRPRFMRQPLLLAQPLSCSMQTNPVRKEHLKRCKCFNNTRSDALTGPYCSEQIFFLMCSDGFDFWVRFHFSVLRTAAFPRTNPDKAGTSGLRFAENVAGKTCGARSSSNPSLSARIKFGPCGSCWINNRGIGN